ncbi:MAG TPA: phosphoribosylformylglycinamidine synthase subunit PurS [Phycisphaerales bacterium]|nr:phosphoribosylformylglycinamidine synthase subunit PurS [Phycisphaerales bacterium]
MPTPAAPATPTTSVHRVEVRPADPASDPRGRRVLADAASLGFRLDSVAVARVYLVEGALDAAEASDLAARLLTDPVAERFTLGAAPTTPTTGQSVEVHPLPGVMDPTAQTVADAIRDLTGEAVRVSTGWRYDLTGPDAPRAEEIARRLLANTVVHAVHTHPFHPDRLPAGRRVEQHVRHVTLTPLSDADLERLSRDAHLFLSLDEMRAIRDHYRALGREPTDVELETLAQTWSEHCVHKTLKSRIRYRSGEVAEWQSGKVAQSREGATAAASGWSDPIDWEGRPGHTIHADGTVEIDNLLKRTVAAATHELIADGVDWTLSVFEDNSGVIALDETNAVCIKVETHNHPSAIEPYGGAATGIGGCIRDVIGTGLGAKPIASTDVFCVAFPGNWNAESAEWSAESAERNQNGDAGTDTENPSSNSASTASLSETSAFALPAGCLHPRRVLTEVVAGVRDYGNRMGIPTVNGAIWFDDRYVGNPLVFCGCVGLLPRDRVRGRARHGDLIVALGGRTGRDGIHGATFSSAELTDTHADEFAHAVQIGNAIEEKRVLDAILRARDEHGEPLYHAITDCGAGGFSSAVGEMGRHLGAEVHLDRAPLKYDGLTYTEIWISEAQERMVLALPPENLDALRRICEEEHVEAAVLGEFGTPDEDLILRYDRAEVGRLSMDFLHDGLPMPTRDAVWMPSAESTTDSAFSASPSAPSAFIPSIQDALVRLLAHPNIASKHWIIRQYDHEVQGNAVVKPLVGPASRGPGDAAVLEPVPGSGRGIAIASGLATGVGDPAIGGDPYLMALAAVDECVRNLVCVGADPTRTAILDNFCWPSCKDAGNLAALVRAAEGCYDAAKAYRTPFVSGKDSLNNQFTTEDGRTIAIPPTLLITGLAIVPDLARCVTSDAKRPGNVLLLIGRTSPSMGGSHYQQAFGLGDSARSLADDVAARVEAVVGPLPETARRHVDALLHGIAPVIVDHLGEAVALGASKAEQAVRRLAKLVGREKAESLEAEVGRERAAAIVNAIADAARRGWTSPAVPTTDLELGPAKARAVAAVIAEGLAASAHDCSDGGTLVAVAEMLIAGSRPHAPIGAELTHDPDDLGAAAWAFAETPSRYLLEVPPLGVARVREIVQQHATGAVVQQIGVLDFSGRLRWPAASLDAQVEVLARAWRAPLDW